MEIKNTEDFNKHIKRVLVSEEEIKAEIKKAAAKRRNNKNTKSPCDFTLETAFV